MMRTSSRLPRTLALLIALTTLPALAGTQALTWDPVTQNEDASVCTDLAGYRV
ncbi:MAG: hypothetical protein LAO51_07080 [Acidobacteriia bacterium]|nr:hypothetical protein [Terriglobia bacterium]